jgi:hypothetical protein
MAKRILLAGILGGIALFLWGGLSHMALGLGEIGVQALPQQQSTVDAMKASIAKSGFYFFPHGDTSRNLTPAEANGPWGILIYHPTGASFAMSHLLVNECILNIVQALLAAFLLSLATGLGGYVSRVGFVAALGLLATIGISIEYWNWYGFPANYTAATVADKFVGFLIVGLVAAALIRPAPARIEAVVTAKAA